MMLLHLPYSGQIRLDTPVFCSSQIWTTSGSHFSIQKHEPMLDTSLASLLLSHHQVINSSRVHPLFCFSFCHPGLYPLNPPPPLLHDRLLQYHWPAIIPLREIIFSSSGFCIMCPIKESFLSNPTPCSLIFKQLNQSRSHLLWDNVSESVTKDPRYLSIHALYFPIHLY